MVIRPPVWPTRHLIQFLFCHLFLLSHLFLSSISFTGIKIQHQNFFDSLYFSFFRIQHKLPMYRADPRMCPIWCVPKCVVQVNNYPACRLLQSGLRLLMLPTTEQHPPQVQIPDQLGLYYSSLQYRVWLSIFFQIGYTLP